jgi:Holliday junction resolvase RusA-like endonuclease
MQPHLFATAEPVASSPNEIRFVVYGEAQSAGSKRAFKNPRSDRIIVTDDNPKSRHWKTAVASEARLHVGEGAALFDGPLELRLVFYRPRPKGHFGVKGLRAKAPPYPTTKPDTTKLIRAVEDALTKIVWRDDAQVVRQSAEKVYGEPARVEILIRPL